MRFFRKSAIHLFWIFAMGYALPGVSVTAAGPVAGVQYDKQTEMLTVHVQEAPLNEVLRTISAASGFKLSMQAGLNRLVTMSFTAVPLDKAIQRLVRPNSSAMIYSKKEDGAVVLTSVRIFDNGETLSSPLPEVTDHRSRADDSSHDSSSSSLHDGILRAVGKFARDNREDLPDQNGNGINRENRNQRGAGAIGKTRSLNSAGLYVPDDGQSDR